MAERVPQAPEGPRNPEAKKGGREFVFDGWGRMGERKYTYVE
ncbi:hypothetical protein [Halosimplex rubrum]|nr:hypothetical protein [Halosimplex rubrum]